MNSFKHGGDVKAFALKLKCKEDEIIDLSSNINFIKPHIKTDLNSIDISKYQNYDDFYKKLSKFYGVKKNQLEIFNGGSSAIFSFIRNSKSKNVYIYSPAYLEYKKACKIYGKNIILINRFYKVNEKEHIKKCSTIIFVNPSTPDGIHYNLDKKLEYWNKKGCKVLIDESFIDFTKYKTQANKINSYDNLYILKSMTKFYSCASVRFGVIISNKHNIKEIKDKEPLWKVSIYDRVYIQDIIENKKFIAKTLKENKKAKAYLKNILQNSKHIEFIHKSDANFFLVELKKLTAKAFQKRLLKHKILIRDCSNFDYLNKYHVRIAVKSIPQLDLFKKALKSF